MVIVTGRSEDAGLVTGANLLVDGGRTAVVQDDTLPDYCTRREGDRDGNAEEETA